MVMQTATLCEGVEVERVRVQHDAPTVAHHLQDAPAHDAAHVRVSLEAQALPRLHQEEDAEEHDHAHVELLRRKVTKDAQLERAGRRWTWSIELRICFGKGSLEVVVERYLYQSRQTRLGLIT